MKRLVSLLVLISVFLPLMTFFAYAEESEIQSESEVLNSESGTEEETTQEIKRDILYFSCTYDAETKTVNVSGTMKHDAFAQYNNSTLEIFLIPPGKTELDVIADPKAEPLAQTSASIKFGFNFKLSKLVDRYSRYAIFLKSPDGERILATEAQYADVQSTFTAAKNKESFKGIAGAISSSSAYLDADTTIIPVYIDMLFTDTSHGYVYQGESKQFFFTQGYIDDLDKKINSASISGSDIYLQLLLRKGSTFSNVSDTEAEYVMPNVYDEAVLVKLHSAIDFLSSRYSTADHVDTFGFIIGKGWDNPSKYNGSKYTEFEKYVESCAFYATVVSNAARSVNSNIDIVLPFTGEGFKNEYDPTVDIFSVKPLINALIEYYENSFSSGMSFSLLMETREVPLNINNANISSGIDLTYKNPNTDFVAGYQTDFSTFIKDTAQSYSGNLTKYMFVWSPPATLKGNALSAAYTYSYYKLLSDERISAFCVCLDDENQIAVNFEDLKHIIRYIDTSQGVLVTNNLVSYFGKLSWEEITGAPISTVKRVKSLYSISPEFSLPSGIKGSFSYFDFAGSTILDGWYNGSGCGKIKIEYTKDEKKALKADLAMTKGAASELIYSYKYQENMRYTPYLEISMGIVDDLDSSLYKVTVVIENEASRYESSYVVEGNTDVNVVLNTSEIQGLAAVSDIKIFVTSLDGNYGKCSLWLYGITGHSTKYSSGELKDLIYEEREKINDTADGATQERSWKNIIVAAGIVAVTTIFCTAMLWGFRRSRSNNDND